MKTVVDIIAPGSFPRAGKRIVVLAEKAIKPPKRMYRWLRGIHPVVAGVLVLILISVNVLFSGVRANSAKRISAATTCISAERALITSEGIVDEGFPVSGLAEGWRNVEAAQGLPDLDKNADATQFLSKNSATLKAGSGSIICTGFTFSDDRRLSPKLNISLALTPVASSVPVDKIEAKYQPRWYDGLFSGLFGNKAEAEEGQESVTSSQGSGVEEAEGSGIEGETDNSLLTTDNFPIDIIEDGLSPTPIPGVINQLPVTDSQPARPWEVEDEVINSVEALSIPDVLSVQVSADRGGTWQEVGLVSAPFSNVMVDGYLSFDLPDDALGILGAMMVRVVAQDTGGLVAVSLDSIFVTYSAGEENEIEIEPLDDDGRVGNRPEETPVFGRNKAAQFEFKARDPEKGFLVNLFSGSQVEPDVRVNAQILDESDVEIEDAKADVIWQGGRAFGYAAWNIELTPPRELPTGRYTLAVEFIDDGGNAQNIEQDFLWGVLAINVNKSIYLPDETVEFAFGVLDEAGDMVCDANLTLDILGPSFKKTLSTENGKIVVNKEECSTKAVTERPDYEATMSLKGVLPEFQVGVYNLTLTAETGNGIYTIKDSFEVRDYVPFDIERTGPTRIYPPSPYTVGFTIRANEDFEGSIVETVPASFEIVEQGEVAGEGGVAFSDEPFDSAQDKLLAISSDEVEAESVENGERRTENEGEAISPSSELGASDERLAISGEEAPSPSSILLTPDAVSETSASPEDDGSIWRRSIHTASYTKETRLTWDVELEKGKTYTLRYKFDAPDISPEFWLLGPLTFFGKIKEEVTAISLPKQVTKEPVVDEQELAGADSLPSEDRTELPILNSAEGEIEDADNLSEEVAVIDTFIEPTQDEIELAEVIEEIAENTIDIVADGIVPADGVTYLPVGYREVFREIRQWQIASDVMSEIGRIQAGYIFENDDGGAVDTNTQQAGSQFSTGKTLASVRRGERITTRLHIENDGTEALSSDVALFYDRNDGYWTKVREEEPISITSSGNCAGFDAAGGSVDFDCTQVFDGADVSDGDDIAITIDSHGLPWVAFKDDDEAGGDDVIVAHYVGSGGNCDDTGSFDGGSDAWACDRVFDGEDANDGDSLTIGANTIGEVWIAFKDDEAGGDDLIVAKYVGSGGDCDSASFDGTGSDAWDCDRVFAGLDIADVPNVSNFVFDATTFVPWIAWGDDEGTADDVLVAKYVGSGGDCDTASFDDGATNGSDLWDCDRIFDGADDLDGGEISLAINESNAPWIVFQDVEAGANDVVVAQFVTSGGDCDTSAFDNGAVGGSDAWDCERVFDGADTDDGRFASIAISPGLSPWIAFKDDEAGGDDLIVAQYVTSGGDCDTSAFDNGAVGGSDKWDCDRIYQGGETTDVGSTSMLFDPGGRAWVTMTDNESGADNLILLRYVGSGGDCDTLLDSGGSDAWECEMIFDGGEADAAVGEVALDPYGVAWMAFQDEESSTGDVVVAKLLRGGEIRIGTGLAGANGASLSESHADMTSATDTINRDDAADCLTATSWSNGKWFETEDGASVTLPAGNITTQCTEVAFVIDTSEAVAGTTYRFTLAFEDALSTERNGLWKGVSQVTTYPELSVEASTTKRYAKGAEPKLPTCVSSDWGCEIVNNSASEGSNTDMAINALGMPVISYRQSTLGALAIAEYVGDATGSCTNTNWDCTVVYDTANAMGYESSIDIDKNGHYWISFQDTTTDDMIVARQTPGSSASGGCIADWTCEIVDSSTACTCMTSLKIDPGGVAWVTFWDNTSLDIRYARYVGNAKGNCDDTDWDCGIIESGAAGTGATGIDFDNNGVAMVTYRLTSGGSPLAGQLRFARYVGIGGTGCGTGSPEWTCITIVDISNTPAHTTIAVNPVTNAPWIAYSENNDKLSLAVYTGTGTETTCTGYSADWDCYVIRDGINGYGSDGDIEFTAEGVPWIAYRDIPGNDLEVAHYVGGGNGSGCDSGSADWVCETINATNAGDYFNGIEIDPSGVPWISYYDANSTALGVAKLNMARDGDADGQYQLDRGKTPATEGTCSATADSEGYCALAADDSDFDSITALADERPFFTFATRTTDNVDTQTTTWTGQSTVAASTDNILLQVYRYGSTNAWETVDTVSTGCSGSDCTASGSPSGGVADYFLADGSNYWTFWRVYQVENTSSKTLKSDYFNISFTQPTAVNPVGLSQIRALDNAFVATGDTLRGDASPIILRANAESSNLSDELSLEVELRDTETTFTSVKTHTGVAVQNDADRPARRRGQGFVYDSVNEQIVAFGGQGADITPYVNMNDVWVLSLKKNQRSQWKQLSPSGTAPSARRIMMMVYDSVDTAGGSDDSGRVVIYGGRTDSGDDTGTVYFLDMTAGAEAWSSSTVGSGPTDYTVGNSYAYDSSRDQMWFFGGRDAADSALTDNLWILELDGTEAFIQKTPTGTPTELEFGSMVYDPVNDYIWQHGGCDGTTPAGCTRDSDTFKLTTLGGTPVWTNVSPGTCGPHSAGGINGHSMVYDPGNDQVVVFGGKSTAYNSDVYTFDTPSSGNVTCTDHSVSTNESPQPRGFGSPTGVYDPVHDQVLFGFGFNGSAYVKEVIVFDDLANTGTWGIKQIYDVVRFQYRDQALMIYDSLNDTAWTAAGAGRVSQTIGPQPGAYHLNETWEFSTGTPGSEALYDSGANTGPIAREAGVFVYDSVDTTGDGIEDGHRGIYCGGIQVSTRIMDCWELKLPRNGEPAEWQPLFPTGTIPAARWGAVAVYDADRDRMVMFGGGAGAAFNDVWELDLDGSPAWTAMSPTGTAPTIRQFATAIYDVTGDRMIIYGGSSSGTYRDDVLALTLPATGDGVWSTLHDGTGQTVADRDRHSAIYDPNSGGNRRMLIFGGYDGAQHFNDVRSYDLVADTWNNISPTGTAPPVQRSMSDVYDPTNDRWIIISGRDADEFFDDFYELDLSPATPAWTTLIVDRTVPVTVEISPADNDYHWKARVDGTQTLASSWVAYGGNSDTVVADTDFSIETQAKFVQEGYIFENDDEDEVAGDVYDENTQQAGSEFSSGKTLTSVRKGERITLRTQVTNDALAHPDTTDLALFYDRNDDVWTKVAFNEPVEISVGDCSSFDQAGGSSLWDCTKVTDGDSASDVRYASIAIGTDGRPWVSFQNTESSQGDLVVAQYVGSGGNCDAFDVGGGGAGSTAWSCTTVIDGDNANDSLYTDIAIAPDGSPWVVVNNVETEYDLVVANYVGTAGQNCDGFDDVGGSDFWNCTKVTDGDSTSDAKNPQITFAPDGTAYISFLDTESAAGNLAVAKYVGANGNCDEFDQTGGSTLWDCTTVTDGDNANDGLYSSIAIAPDGRPWVSFQDIESAQGNLVVANYVGTSGQNCDGFDDTLGSDYWNCTLVIDGDNAADAVETSLAFAPDGSAWVSMQNTETAATSGGNLVVANYVGTSGQNCDGFDDTLGSDYWNCTTVTDGDNASDATNSSLAFAPDGSAWVSFLDLEVEGNLVLAQYVGTAGENCDGFDDTLGSDVWKCTTVFNGDSASDVLETSLAFGVNGNAWTAFTNLETQGDLVVANVIRGGEIVISPALGAGDGDGLNESHANMTTVSDTTNRDNTTCLDGTATWVNGKFFESENGDGLSIADGSSTGKCTEVAWTIDTSQAQPNTTYRFAVASNDAWNPNSGAWRGPVSVATDGYPTLVMEAVSADPYIRYAKDAMPKFVNCTDTAWGCETIDAESSETASAGLWSSLAFAPDGTPWVSYRDVLDLDLRVARYVGSGGTGCGASVTSWTCEAVETTNSVGAYTSLAFAPDGTPWVSYHYSTTRDLRVAYYVGGGGGTGCDDADWTCADIETTNQVGTETSIAFDVAGNPWITHRDIDNDALRIARYTGSGTGTSCADVDWECKAIDDTGTIASPTMAMSPEGIPWVSWQNSFNGTLRVGRYVGSGGTGCATGVTDWNCTTVYSATTVQTGVPIVFDDTGKAWVVYVDSAGDAWVAEFVGGAGGTGCADSDWTCTKVVDDDVDDESTYGAAADADGNVWFVYSQGTNDDAWIAHYVGSGGNCDALGSATGSDAWQCDKIDNIVVDDGVYTGHFASIAFDGSGVPWMTYFDKGDGTCNTTDECKIKVAKMHLPPTDLSDASILPYNSHNAGSGDARYRLDFGDPPRGAGSPCDAAANAEGYCGVSADDTDYDSIDFGTNERGYYTFAVRNSSNSTAPTGTWIARSTVAPTAETLHLETYRYGTTNAWESIDTDLVCAANTDCTLTGTAGGTASEYFEADGSNYWTYWRAYQEEGTAGTLTTDSIAVTFASGTDTISGTLYQDDTSTPIDCNAANKTVNVKVNGTGSGTVECTAAGGTYTVDTGVTLSLNDTITVYLDNETENAVTYTNASGAGNVAGLDLFQNHVIIRSENATVIGNSDIEDWDYADEASDGDIGVDVVTSNATLQDAWKLLVWTGDTYTPGGTVTTSVSADGTDTVVDGDVEIQASGTLNMASNALSIGGDYLNSGTFTTTTNTVTFNADTASHEIAGTLNGTSAFYHIQFSDPSGSDASWTIQSAMLVDGAETDNTFVIDNGTVTVGNGDNDDLEIRGTVRIADTANETGTLQTKQDLAEGTEIIIDIGTNTPTICEDTGVDSCKIYVGATSGTGTGTLDIGKNVRLRLNPFDDGGGGADSDSGIEVQATGYLEIQGTQDATATSGTGTTATKLCTNAATAWTASQFNGMNVRITSPWATSKASGDIYEITATTVDDAACSDNASADSITINQNAGTSDSTPTVTALAGDQARIDFTGEQVSANDEHIGRYIFNSTDTEYYRIVDSTTATPDTVTVVGGFPDALTNLATNDTVQIVDTINIGTGVAFEILDYAIVQAESNACAATVNTSGEAYIFGKTQSETLIQYADICNLGRNTTDKYGVSFNNVDAVDGSAGFFVDTSRIRSGYHGIYATGSKDNNDSRAVYKGIQNSYVSGNTWFGIYLGSSSNNTLSSNTSSGNATYGIRLNASSNNNTLSSNIFSGNASNGIYLDSSSNNTLSSNTSSGDASNGIYLGSSSNNILSSNTSSGNATYGIRLFSSSNNTLSSNTSSGNANYGIYLDSSSNNTLFSNSSYNNATGLYIDNSTGTKVISDNYGGSGINTTQDIYFNNAVAENLTMYNTTLASDTPDSVNGVTSTDDYVISYKHDGVNGATKVWGEYSIPNDNTETPQNEALAQFNYANGLWERSMTEAGYSGTGSEDTVIAQAYSGAWTDAGDVFAYRIVCRDDAVADCDSIVTTTNAWDVYRYSETGTETDIGDVDKQETFTDSITGAQFNFDGGTSVATAYATGDTYIFTAWNASSGFGTTDVNVQKDIQFMQDADLLTVGTGETLEIKGDTSTQINCDDAARRTLVSNGVASSGYQIIATGTVDFQCADFDDIGGTGQSVGLDIQAGATVTSLDNTAWDNFAVNVGASDTYIQVVNSIIDAGEKLISGIVFDDNGDGADTNVNFNVTNTGANPGVCTDAWKFESSGNMGDTINGETNDSDTGDGGGCNGGSGYMIFFDNNALSINVVDTQGELVAAPDVPFGAATFGFECQATTGTLGVAAEKLRVTNGTTNAQWNLTIQATGGATDDWNDGGTNTYDFNDPSGTPAGCADGGGDADSIAGQLTVDPSVLTIAPLASCTTADFSLGTLDAFEQGATNIIDILTAGANADTECLWDVTGVGLSQQVPAQQTAASYTTNMTITVTAI